MREGEAPAEPYLVGCLTRVAGVELSEERAKRAPS